MKRAASVKTGLIVVVVSAFPVFTGCFNLNEEGDGGASAPTATGVPTEIRQPLSVPWIGEGGRFAIPTYDDRELFSDEEKERHPVFDPRWASFTVCMEARGQTVRDDASAPTNYDDLSVLADRLNALNPDGDANRFGEFADTAPDGLTAAFVDCAGELGRSLTDAELEASTLQAEAQARAIWQERLDAGTPVPEDILDWLNAATPVAE